MTRNSANYIKKRTVDCGFKRLWHEFLSQHADRNENILC